MKYSFQALGTQWWIEIFDELAAQRGDEVKDFITTYVSTYEQNYSRFQPDSLVSTLNRDRTVVNPTPEFVQLLEYGKRLYLRSDTHFNLLTGHILESKGYDADYTFTASGPAVGPGNPVIDLQISPDLITLTGESNLDLGGFGKGYLVDMLARQLQHTHGIEQFLINGGGDMYATHNNNQPITIHLEHPTKPGVMITNTTLYNNGFAASSPHRRVWENSTGTHTHIIADNLTADATFIKAATTADADAFATATLMMNQHQIEQLVKTERLAVAQFNAQSEQLKSTKNFSS